MAEEGIALNTGDTWAAQRRLPPWLRVRMPAGPNYREVRRLLAGASLHTICEEARCPNVGECWERRTATFMILGRVCTRNCLYCAVASGRPTPVDCEEPDRVAQVVERLGLRYAVVTSVTRDDLPDGGASAFAATVKAIRRRVPGCEVEVLIPDFSGSRSALQSVMDARPGVLNHNIEVVRALFSRVRPQGDYSRSLELLARAKEMRPGCVTKSGFMVGLGEDRGQVRETMHDLRGAGCDLLTIGQYLPPSPRHFPVARFYTPQEFEELRREAETVGFVHVASGPLVRSSYRADEQHARYSWDAGSRY